MRAHGLALGLCLAIGMVISAWLVGNTIRQVKFANDTITVQGYAEVGVTADTGVWRGKLVVRGLTLGDAYRELELSVKRFMEFAAEQGIETHQIDLEQTVIQVNHPVINGQVQAGRTESYILERRFSYSSGDVGRIGEIARASDDLLRLGVELQSRPPEYYVNAIDDVKLDLLAMATTNARERAERLAQGSGVEVGRLRSAHQEAIRLTKPNSTAAADDEIGTRSIGKMAKAVVTVTYAIEP